MILQALCDYYDRKKERGEMAPDGFIEKEIDFAIRLEEDGSFREIYDLREPVGKRMVGQSYNVPAIGKQVQKHTNAGNDANLLWDNSAFVLGIGNKGEAKRRSFVEAIRTFYPDPPADVRAVLAFLENDGERERVLQSALANESYGEVIESGAPLMSFRVGQGELIISQPHVGAAISGKAPDEPSGICLVSGEQDIPIAIAHWVLKGIAGGQSSGCNLVSFNAPSFCSYGLEQSFNAPTGIAAAEAYVKALQSLIDSEKNSVRLGDVTVVFWAQRAEYPEAREFEDALSIVLWGSNTTDDHPDRGVGVVKGMLNSLRDGKYMEAIGDFYVLGVSPNAARLSVRNWEAGPVMEFARRIGDYFDDFAIVRSPQDDREYLSVAEVLRATVLEYKMSNVPPNLAGALLHSVLSGSPYPVALFQAAVRRIRAERRVTRARAAILKAYLNRKGSVERKEEGDGEFGMALDKTNGNTAYRLGRLFAVLEKIQEDALPDLNAGIRDRYYGAASSTPVTVFSRLLDLKNHHLKKLDKKIVVFWEKKIAEIIAAIDGFPTHLSLEDQGRFAIGYYHQRQDIYTKTESKLTEADTEKEDVLR